MSEQRKPGEGMPEVEVRLRIEPFEKPERVVDARAAGGRGLWRLDAARRRVRLEEEAGDGRPPDTGRSGSD